MVADPVATRPDRGSPAFSLIKDFSVLRYAGDPETSLINARVGRALDRPSGRIDLERWWRLAGGAARWRRSQRRRPGRTAAGGCARFVRDECVSCSEVQEYVRER